jgi:hypothetical protein
MLKRGNLKFKWGLLMSTGPTGHIGKAPTGHIGKAPTGHIGKAVEA